jgi:hypothetical protein
MHNEKADKKPTPFERFVAMIARVPKSEADEVARDEKRERDEREKRSA